MALPPVAALTSSYNAALSIEGNKIGNVKQERDDEAEIAELAAKMVEQNKAKLAAAHTASAGRNSGMGVNHGQSNILNFFNRNKNQGTSLQDRKKSVTPAIDEQSLRGRFGWVTLAKTVFPFIIRDGDVKYLCVRLLEEKVLNKYLNYLHSDIYSCVNVKSFKITDIEAKLFTEINVKHCDNHFGSSPFTTEDHIVRIDDAKEFYCFVDVCYNKLANCGVNGKEKCGFIRINNESVVPYTVKDCNKYVPLFYFEGETDNLKLKAEKLENWDLAYLKFCCKVQGIRNELFASETCSVISLSDIKSYFPSGTVFEDYWPQKVVDSAQLLVTKNSGQQNAGSSWIKPPLGSVQSPTKTTTSTVVVNKVTPTVRTVPQVPGPQQTNPSTHVLHNGWPGLVGGQQSYPIVSQAQQNTRIGQMNLPLHNINTSITPRAYPAQRGNISAAPPQYYSTPHQMALGSSQVTPQPPPLVRATVATPTMGNTTYTNSSMNIIPSSGSMHLMGLQNRTGSMLPPPPHLQYNSTTANSQQQGTKFPPPLIPVNGSANQRYYHPSGTEIIDLSSPPQSPSQRISGLRNGIQQQSQLQQSALTVDGIHSELSTKLIPITESAPSSGSHHPFKIQKALVCEKMVPSINAKPFTYTEMLITLPDLHSYFFPEISLDNCKEAITALKLNMYRGNSQQMQVLKDSQKCQSVNDIVPLVQLRDISQCMPQLRYVIDSIHANSGELPTKRQRTS
uniref:Uncharacterized protein n=2 Tax=Clastoptera arizonana TaxID=38151 RepID=A0A1B6EDD5_9HEMI